MQCDTDDDLFLIIEVVAEDVVVEDQEGSTCGELGKAGKLCLISQNAQLVVTAFVKDARLLI